MTKALAVADPGPPNGSIVKTGGSPPERILPVAPLVPIVTAVAVGIVLDRSVEPFGHAPETQTWSVLGFIFVTLTALSSHWPRFSLFALLAVCVATGAGWHHHRRFDLAPDDLAWSISEAPHPVLLRGMIREAMGVRRTGPTTGGNIGGGPGASNNAPERVSTRFVIDVTSVRDGEIWRPATGRALATVAGDRSDVQAGQSIEAAGSVSRLAPPLNPGEFDYRDHLRGDGIWLRLAIKDPSSLRPGDPRDDRISFRWLGAVRARSRDRLVGTLDPNIAPLASALLLGQREEIDDDVNDAFVRTGTTHLLAISGLNLQFLALALGLAFHLAGLTQRWSAFGVAVAIIAYALLVGLSPSVVRSAVMTVTICLAVIFYRQSRTLNNLALAGLVTLAFNPTDLFDVGCQLSFLAIVALVWLIPEARQFLESSHRVIRDRLEGPPSPLDALERKYEPAWKRVPRRLGYWVYSGLLASVVVWLVAFPVVTLRFHLVSPIGILLNIPLVLITSVALLTGGIGLGFSLIWTPLGTPWGWFTSQLLSLTTWIVRQGSAVTWGHRFIAGPPWWWVCVFYAILGIALVAAVIVRDREAERSRTWFAWRRFLWLLVILWLVPGWPLAVVSDRPERVEADLLAVGHGLATVIQTPSGAAYLYDCGRMGDPTVGRRVIAPALWSRGISRLNSVILSHADDDHYNGLTDLFDRFGIGEVCIPPGFGGPRNPAAEQLIEAIQRRGIPIRTVTSPDSWTVGNARFRLWHPPAGWDKSDATDNARSIVLEVEASGRRLVLTGDLEQLGLVELVARPIAETPIDVLLSPHHGGKTANPDWLYSWAQPRAVLVSQRVPVPGSVDLLSKLERRGTPVYRTWRDGALRLSWDPSGITVHRSVEQARPVPVPVAFAPRTVTMATMSWIPPLAPKAWRWMVATAGFLLGLIGVGLAALIELTAWTLVVPSRVAEKLEESDASTPPLPEGTPIEVTATDGSTLAGKWFPSTSEAGSRGTVLLLHGFGEPPGRLAAMRVPELNRDRWDVAVLDSRGYGESAGPYATFGAREAGDVSTWIDALKERQTSMTPAGTCPLVVWGRSMGGAIAARAAAEADSRVTALVLESPMLDLHAALTRIFGRRRLPFSSKLAQWVLRRANRLAGVTLDRPRLAEIAPKVDCSVLIIQGTEDSLASIDTIRRLAQLFPKPAQVIAVTGAGHTDVVDVGGDEVWLQALEFLARASEESGSLPSETE